MIHRRSTGALGVEEGPGRLTVAVCATCVQDVVHSLLALVAHRVWMTKGSVDNPTACGKLCGKPGVQFDHWGVCPVT